MKLSSNFICFHNEFGLMQTIDIFSEAGFEGIDFNADLQEYYTDSHDEAFYRSVKEYAEKKGISFYQTHAPFPSSFAEEEKTLQRKAEIIKSMRHCSYLGANMIVVHPCKHVNFRENDCYDSMMEYNLAFYRELIPYAEEFHIKIAIENIVGSVTETPEGLLELLGKLDNEVFTVCYDVGHAYIVGQDPVEMLKKLGKVIGCTHIHDNDGVKDRHTLPFYGNIDWEAVMKAFAEVGYCGFLNYEAGYFVKNVPVELRREAAKYMAAVGKHLIEKYESYRKA